MTLADAYEFHIQYSEEDAVFIGSVAEFPWLKADGSTPDQAYAEIRFVVEDAIVMYTDEGKEAPLPLSERESKSDSLGIRMPSVYTKECELENGSYMDKGEEDGTIVILPNECSLENLHEPVETGFSSGKEAW